MSILRSIKEIEADQSILSTTVQTLQKEGPRSSMQDFVEKKFSNTLMIRLFS